MNPEFMALLFGAAIGGSAIAVKTAMNYTARKQERISVRPCLTVRSEAGKDQHFRIILHNSGTGPAYIENFEVKVDNISSAEAKGMGFQNALRKVGIGGLDIISYLPQKEDVINENENSILLEANPMSLEDYNIISTALPRLDFKILYKSEYDEAFIWESNESS